MGIHRVLADQGRRDRPAVGGATGARARRRGVPGDDAGMTLIEIAVALSLMSVFLTVFTLRVMDIHRAANHNEATVTANANIHVAFQRLDNEVRYATSISSEGTAGNTGDWYVEYLTTYTGTPVCVQLRLAGGLLQERRWDLGSPPGGFSALASGVSGTHPFTRKPAGVDGYDYERLLVSLTVNGGPSAPSRPVAVSFTALNSSVDAADPTVCAEGRPRP